MKARGAKLSLYPQNVAENIWYYEERGYIELFVHAEALKNVRANGNLRFKIPKYRLERSLRRMGGHAK